MAYDLALRHPERFAGLMALSSWLPQELARSYLSMPAHQTIRALVQHGAEDPMIPVARGEESAAHLREFGVPVTYSDYDMGHEISAKSLGDLNRWLSGEKLS